MGPRIGALLVLAALGWLETSSAWGQAAARPAPAGAKPAPGGPAAPAGATAGKTALQFKFNPQETLRHQMTNVVTSETKFNKKLQTSRMEQTLIMRQTAKTVEKDGSARVLQTVERVVMKMVNSNDGKTEEVNFDSDTGKLPTEPRQRQMVSSLAAMVGAEYELTIAPNGAMTKIVVPQKILDAMKSSPNAAMMGDLASEEGLKNLLSQGSISFPEVAVKKGDAWKREVAMKLGFGTSTTTTTYTYDGATQNRLEQIVARIDTRLAPQRGSPIQAEMKESVGSGRFWFDNQLGRLVESRIQQRSVTAVTLPEGVAETTMNMDVTLKLLASK